MINESSVKFGFKGGLGGGVYYMGKKQSSSWLHRNAKNVGLAFGSMLIIFLFDSFMVSVFNSMILENASLSTKPSTGLKEEENSGSSSYVGEKKQQSIEMYSRLLNLASAALAEKDLKPDSSSLWKEPYPQASQWRPCSDRKLPISPGTPKKSNGYILVSANGGLNQQRVAICNAVAVASLLNATLVLPRFLYSNVWKDPSQFGDIYQEEYFVKLLEDEVEIVKDLPPHLRSLDLEAIGSQITDADIVKEAKPLDYIRIALPRLKRNGVVHFLGFGNRLGFDPLPFSLQRLRCKCNFHALKFVPKIQETASLLIQRIRRRYDTPSSMLDKQLLGNFNPILPHKEYLIERGSSKYLALHLRFEEDMVAYSQCDFGGGDKERRELQAYRQVHFPLLIDRLKDSKPISPEDLRILGKCPLTPEEAALVLAGLGYKSRTYIFLAGSHIYGGKSRMHSLTRLYPNLVTKETLLTPTELSPFKNFSSQMAALDFIACATADVFAMTDSGSQLSSLVSGYRTYYGEGRAPTLRPNKKRLAAILLENGTVSWDSFEYRVRKMVDEGHKVHRRRYGRSIYRQPRCPECMCRS